MMESYSVKEKQEQIRENIDRIREEIVKAALSCGRNPDDITPVSYTHLDVYKRQTLSSIWPILRRLSGKKPGLKT